VENVVPRFSQPNWFTWDMPCYCCGCGCSHMFFSSGDHPRLPSFMHSPVLVGKYSSSTLAALTVIKLFVEM
jgi:hypothetical protein